MCRGAWDSPGCPSEDARGCSSLPLTVISWAEGLWKGSPVAPMAVRLGYGLGVAGESLGCEDGSRLCLCHLLVCPWAAPLVSPQGSRMLPRVLSTLSSPG